MIKRVFEPAFSRARFLLFLAVLPSALTIAARAQAPAAPALYGIVSSKSQKRPLSGCTVSLVHPVAGRSRPAFSAANGYYFFETIPPRPDPYYIEAYWGSRLLFRSALIYSGGSVRFDILLP